MFDNPVPCPQNWFCWPVCNPIAARKNNTHTKSFAQPSKCCRLCCWLCGFIIFLSGWCSVWRLLTFGKIKLWNRFFFAASFFLLLRLNNFTLLTFHVRYRLQCTAHIHIHLNSLVSSSIHWLSRPFNWFNQLWAINHMGCGTFECLSLFWASSSCNRHLRWKVQNSNYFTLIATSSFLNFTLVWTDSKKPFPQIWKFTNYPRGLRL